LDGIDSRRDPCREEGRTRCAKLVLVLVIWFLLLLELSQQSVGTSFIVFSALSVDRGRISAILFPLPPPRLDCLFSLFGEPTHFLLLSGDCSVVARWGLVLSLVSISATGGEAARATPPSSSGGSCVLFHHISLLDYAPPSRSLHGDNCHLESSPRLIFFHLSRCHDPNAPFPPHLGIKRSSDALSPFLADSLVPPTRPDSPRNRPSNVFLTNFPEFRIPSTLSTAFRSPHFSLE